METVCVCERDRNFKGHSSRDVKMKINLKMIQSMFFVG